MRAPCDSRLSVFPVAFYILWRRIFPTATLHMYIPSKMHIKENHVRIVYAMEKRQRRGAGVVINDGTFVAG